MPLNDKDLHLSTTSGQENNGFQLSFLATDPDLRGISPIQWLVPLRPKLINSLNQSFH